MAQKMGSFLLLEDFLSPPFGEKTAFRLLSDSSLCVRIKTTIHVGNEMEFKNSLSMTSSQYVNNNHVPPTYTHIHI